MPIIANDPFNRTVATGSLGNEPVSGLAYALAAGTAANGSVDGDKAKLVMTSLGVPQLWSLGVSATEFDETV